jgi:hypothetical protein
MTASAAIVARLHESRAPDQDDSGKQHRCRGADYLIWTTRNTSEDVKYITNCRRDMYETALKHAQHNS